MATTSAERYKKMADKRKELGQKPYRVWVTDAEKAIIKPVIEERLKELRAKESKK